MSAKSKTVYLNSDQKEEAEGIYSDIGQRFYQGLNGIERSDFFAIDFNGKGHPDFTITKEALLELVNSESVYTSILASISKKQKSPLPEGLPKKYIDTAINVAVVQNILPKFLPEKGTPPSDSQKRDLGWQCFQALSDALIINGAQIKKHVTVVRKRTDAYIHFFDEYAEEIEVNYDSFRHTFKILLLAYRHNLPLDKKRF